MLLTHFLHNIFAVVEYEWKRNYKSLNLQKKIKSNFREILPFLHIASSMYIPLIFLNAIKIGSKQISALNGA